MLKNIPAKTYWSFRREVPATFTSSKVYKIGAGIVIATVRNVWGKHDRPGGTSERKPLNLGGMGLEPFCGREPAGESLSKAKDRIYHRNLVELVGIEPTTSSLRTMRSPS